LKWKVSRPQTWFKHKDLFSDGLVLPSIKPTKSDKSLIKREVVLTSIHDFSNNRAEKYSTSVPIQLNVGVDWNKSNFKQAVDEQWKIIVKERDKKIKEYTEQGANFGIPQSVRPDEKYQPALIQLGHYRLLVHCEFSESKWKEIQKIFTPYDYSSMKVFRRCVKDDGNEISFPSFNSLFKRKPKPKGTSKIIFG
jgi:hypothetical protein